jgi:hypothetical protein
MRLRWRQAATGALLATAFLGWFALPGQLIRTEPAPPHDALVLPSDSATSAVEAHAPARPAPARRAGRTVSRPAARPQAVARHAVVAPGRVRAHRGAPARPQLVSRPLPVAHPKPVAPKPPRPVPAPSPAATPAAAPASPAAASVERTLQSATETAAEPTRRGHGHDKKDKPQRGREKKEHGVPASLALAVPPVATETEQEPTPETRPGSDASVSGDDVGGEVEEPAADDGHGRGHAWGHDKK